VRFDSALIEGKLVRRYKRFLADVELENGEVVTAHTANPGRMIGLTTPGSTVYLSQNNNPKRKLRYTWELLKVGRRLVGINPARANGLAVEAIEAGQIPELRDYPTLRREVAYGQRRSRIDILLEDPKRPACYVEVKNVTLLAGEGVLFPDAVTARGRKHLLELQDEVASGNRAVLLYLVQRPEPTWVGTADHIDPAYGETFRSVLASGVEALAYRVQVGTHHLQVTDSLPVRPGPQAR
jgi:sugar fermentation stimulation protein A